MAERQQPRTAAGRFKERELARIDAAARLRGLLRSQFVRLAVLERAEQELRLEVERGTDEQAA